MINSKMLTAQHSTAQHSTAQHSKWGSNLGLATIASDGTVTLKANTAMVKVNISKNKNPYFGLTRR